MANTKKPWRKLMGCFIFSLLPTAAFLSCCDLSVKKTILLGTTVTATCTIRKNHCPFKEEEEIQMIWKLDNQTLRGTQYSLGNGDEVSNITVGPLNNTTTTLSCWIQRKNDQQVMDIAQIRAGYLPSKPQNLSCLMNITSEELTCHWDPGKDSLFPTKVALFAIGSQESCELPLAGTPQNCTPSTSPNSCSITRGKLLLYHKMLFWVFVKNDLGFVESEPLCADPMDLVKLDPPVLQDLQSDPEETDCVSVIWEVPPGSSYMTQSCDLRYQMEGDQKWTVVHNFTDPYKKIHHCGFLFNTRYWFQMRCQKLPVSYWSDWSPPKNYTTHEKAPTGSLDAWWKVTPQEGKRNIEVQLLWKPMKASEAHGKILGYWTTRSLRQSSALCNTTETQCRFLLPSGTRKIHLMAYNAKGVSPPTEVILLEKKGRPVSKIQTTPHDSESLWVSWDPPRVPVIGYIIEWQRVISTDSVENSTLEWTKLHNSSLTRFLILKHLKPFQRYLISIYPLYSNCVGMPQYTEAYSMQGAPSEAPKVNPKSISKSKIELHWESIPVERRNGFITSYTIFWMAANEKTNSVVVNSSVNAFTITGLLPSKKYTVHIMASTINGSTNGTILTLYTKEFDDMDLPMVYIIIGFLLLVIIVLIFCFQKSKRMKTQFWPSVPDPANSSLGRWAPVVLHEETLQPPKSCELSPVIVSAILVIEKDEKKCLSCGKNELIKALEERPSAISKLYAPDTDGVLPDKTPAPVPYVNSPESVQYAKVLGDTYHSQQDESPTFYVRSNSTQPLLCNGTPSPKPYENLWFHGDQLNGDQEDTVFLDRALLDFPLLQGLRIEGDEDLSNFRRL
uniref:Colony stimulating factor 3 receptor n=1 Tax=Salvator merianae TaxID=96440 RepID=A0A8D0CD44_SALMN